MLSSCCIGECWQVNADGLGLGKKHITVRDTSFAVKTRLKGQVWQVSKPMNYHPPLPRVPGTQDPVQNHI